MSEFVITPTVDEAQEFIEIATDFSNPLDIVREAISNAFDAKAKLIDISFDVIKEYGESVLQIRLEDNGEGMDKGGLQAFFDLGNSLHRNDPDSIGEKGHGTKVYFNSTHIHVETTNNGITYKATMEDPFRKLFDREIPSVSATEESTPEKLSGTIVLIKGYNNNRRESFTHEIIRDFVIWFTKFGSVEAPFGIDQHKDVQLLLKGLNRDEPEELTYGHYFPENSANMTRLFEEHLVDAPKYYCKRIIKNGKLKNFPEIKYQAIFAIEGNKVKQDCNPMLRRQGYIAPDGSYTVQERYGLWLCKDFIPIQRANEAVE